MEENNLNAIPVDTAAEASSAPEADVDVSPSRRGGEADENTAAEPSARTRREEFERLIKHALKRSSELTQDIMDGKTDISPSVTGSSDACRYCDNRPVCLRDGHIRGGRRRKPPKMKLSQLNELLQAEENET